MLCKPYASQEVESDIISEGDECEGSDSNSECSESGYISHGGHISDCGASECGRGSMRLEAALSVPSQSTR